jgi:hypothetical protein
VAERPSNEAGVRVASTGKEPERFKKLRITSSKPTPRTAMSLAQGTSIHRSLPDLRPGDQLLVSAELEVTTDCENQQPSCAGSPYGYAPRAEAMLLLASGVSRAAPEPDRARKVGKKQVRRCTHARHHDVFVFDNVPYTVPQAGLPWRGSSCINLAIGASNPKAKSGHFLLIGQHEPNGTVKGDMGGISVVRLRPAGLSLPRPLRTAQRQARALAVITGGRAVVYSQKLEGLRRGEQLSVRAKVNMSTAHLSYPARATTEVVLAGGRDDTDPGAEAQRITGRSPQICRGNGFNCLPRESPEAAQKAGAIGIVKGANDPLYVNVFVVVGDPLRRAKSGDELRFVEGGFLEVMRYPAELAG